MHEAGVVLHVGTDTFNPFVVPGAALPLKDLGVLKDGAPADFLIYKEDPTNDLSKLDTLKAVVADGRLYPREVLDAGLQRHHDRYSSRSVQWVMMRLMQLAAPHPNLEPK